METGAWALVRHTCVAFLGGKATRRGPNEKSVVKGTRVKVVAEPWLACSRPLGQFFANDDSAVPVLCINTTVHSQCSCAGVIDQTARRVRTALPSPRYLRDARQACTRPSSTPRASGAEVDRRKSQAPCGQGIGPVEPSNKGVEGSEQGKRQYETRAVLEGAGG